MWFNKKDVFNFEQEKRWEVNNTKIVFPSNKTWIEYIHDIRLEISL